MAFKASMRLREKCVSLLLEQIDLLRWPRSSRICIVAGYQAIGGASITGQ
jgi:hypothetical protein